MSSELLQSAVIEMCDQGHKFAKLPDHPKRAGYARCPYCLAEGFDRLQAYVEPFGDSEQLPQAELSDAAEGLIRKLRSFGVAYPEEVFGPVTDEERIEHSSLITRASALMGRHCAKFMLEAADMIESLATDHKLRAQTKDKS